MESIEENRPVEASRIFSKRTVVPFVVVGSVCLALLFLFRYFAPLEIASVTAYAGITIGLGGLLCLIKPIWWLGISRRKVAALLIVLGLGVLLLGLLWPAGLVQISARHSRLDAFMPEYHFSERHEVLVHADLARAKAALQDVTFDDLKVYHALMRVRGLAFGRNVKTAAIGKRRVLNQISNPASGFAMIESGSEEIVFALTGRPWAAGGVARSKTKEEFEAFNAPNAIKVGANFRLEDAGGGWTRVVTETRIRATDESARRRMGVYWRLVYPGSGMIRRTWLNAVRDRAEAPAA